MDDKGHIIVFVTASTEPEALKIGDVLLQARQAACVNIISGLRSSYWWNGRIESATEFLVVAKTRAGCLDKLIELVKSNHSDKVPQIIAMPVVGGNPDYLTWIDQEVCAT